MNIYVIDIWYMYISVFTFLCDECSGSIYFFCGHIAKDVSFWSFKGQLFSGALIWLEESRLAVLKVTGFYDFLWARCTVLTIKPSWTISHACDVPMSHKCCEWHVEIAHEDTCKQHGYRGHRLKPAAFMWFWLFVCWHGCFQKKQIWHFGIHGYDIPSY